MGEHQALVMSGLQLAAWLGDSHPAVDERVHDAAPALSRVRRVRGAVLSLIGRNPISLIPNPRDLDDIVNSIAKVKPAAFAGVPTLYNGLLNHPGVKSGKVSFDSIKVCASGAAPLLAETRQRFEEVTGAKIIEGYGLTESLIAACVNPVKGESKIGSVGMPVPRCRRADRGRRRPAEALDGRREGEMLLRAPQIMKGYWRNPKADRRDALHRRGRRRLAAHRRPRVHGRGRVRLPRGPQEGRHQGERHAGVAARARGGDRDAIPG